MPDYQRIAVIGAGNIGTALIAGILKAHVAGPHDVVATVQTPARAEEICKRFSIRTSAGNNLEAVESADIVILAVKPAAMPRVVEEVRWGLREDRVLVSLAASFSLDNIAQLVGRHAPTFRAMPNIPVMVEEGATAIAHNGGVSSAQIAAVDRIFKAVGIVCWVEERMLHAVTALSGSGPAYIYMVIEAMIAGGLKMGLSHEVSTKLAEQTVLGAAKLVRDTGLHPAILKDQVVTPAGVTISAIHELEKHGLRSMLISAIETATRHSRHVAQELTEKVMPRND